jgi:hypothetical protein
MCKTGVLQPGPFEDRYDPHLTDQADVLVGPGGERNAKRPL